MNTCLQLNKTAGPVPDLLLLLDRLALDLRLNVTINANGIGEYIIIALLVYLSWPYVEHYVLIQYL